MSNPLQQTIEALAKEKGIEPDVVISAIEEAVATASRKYYKTGENLKTRFNMETGQVDLFALKTVVEEVTNPATEIALTEAREMYRSAWRKFKGQHTLSPLDKQIVAVISEHPEYRVIIESAAADLANYSPRSGQLNPWLHMGLHLAIRDLDVGAALEVGDQLLRLLEDEAAVVGDEGGADLGPLQEVQGPDLGHRRVEAVAGALEEPLHDGPLVLQAPAAGHEQARLDDGDHHLGAPGAASGRCSNG